MGISISRETVVWIGPATEEAVYVELMRIFHAAVRTEADDILGAVGTPTLYDQLLDDLGQSRASFCRPGRLAQLPPQQLLSACVQGYFVAYQDILAEGPSLIGARNARCGLGPEPDGSDACWGVVPHL